MQLQQDGPIKKSREDAIKRLTRELRYREILEEYFLKLLKRALGEQEIP